jgi:hypothetical protein
MVRGCGKLWTVERQTDEVLAYKFGPSRYSQERRKLHPDRLAGRLHSHELGPVSLRAQACLPTTPLPQRCLGVTPSLRLTRPCGAPY